jgi:hypothetical protein
MQIKTRRPNRIDLCANRTKMFHVKLFGTIGEVKALVASYRG